jgi:hypothetical protein
VIPIGEFKFSSAGDDASRLGIKWVFICKLCLPQDKVDESAVNITGIAWVNGSTRNLVVSYEKQGIV